MEQPLATLLPRVFALAFLMGVFVALCAHASRVVALAVSRPGDVPEWQGPGLMDFGRADAILIIAAGVAGGMLAFVYEGTSGQITIAAFGALGCAFVLNLVWRPMSQFRRLWLYGACGNERWLAQSRWFARPLPPWSEASRRYRRSVIAFLTALSLTLLGFSAFIVLEAGPLALAFLVASLIPLFPIGWTISVEIDRFAVSANRPT